MVRGLDPPYQPPILADKDHARRFGVRAGQPAARGAAAKGSAAGRVPEICLLDPDGDIVRALRRAGRAPPSPGWACYHTELLRVRAWRRCDSASSAARSAPSFAVLIAEELFASGCRFLISVTSAGQITPLGPPPYFVVIDRALRDEGTSYHYLPPADFAEAEPGLVAAAMAALRGCRACRSIAARPGRPMRRSAKPPRRSRRCRAPQHPGGRDGGGGALRLCPGARQAGPLPGACHQPDGRQRAATSKRARPTASTASLAVIAAVAAAWHQRRGGAR